MFIYPPTVYSNNRNDKPSLLPLHTLRRCWVAMMNR